MRPGGSGSCGKMETQENVATFPKPLLAKGGLQITCFRDPGVNERRVDSTERVGRSWMVQFSEFETKAAGHD
jgi:hypothetical protein